MGIGIGTETEMGTGIPATATQATGHEVLHTTAGQGGIFVTPRLVRPRAGSRR